MRSLIVLYNTFKSFVISSLSIIHPEEQIYYSTMKIVVFCFRRRVDLEIKTSEVGPNKQTDDQDDDDEEEEAVRGKL